MIVVLGAEIEGSTKALEGLDLEILINEDWSDGMGSSIASGMRAIDTRSDAVLLSLCDQPRVKATHLREFIELFTTTNADVIAASYNDVTGVPALFSSRFFPALASLKGEKGAREIIRNSPDALTIPLPVACIDVDTLDDLDQYAT